MKMNLKRLAFLVLVIGIAAPIQSQSRGDSKTVRKSEKMTINGKTLREITSVDDVKNIPDDKDDHDGEYWFNRGYSMHQSNQYIEAIQAFSRSIGLGHRQATCMYNVACGYAALNDKENSLFWLERSLASGFDRADLLREDSDLDPLRSDARFKEILQKATLVKNETNSSKDKGDKGDKKRDRLDEAIINFEQLNRAGSSDGDQWYKVGSRLLSLRDFERAIAALTQAVDHLGYRGASAMYNLACTYALKGDKEQGLKWLERSVNSGFDQNDKFLEDSDIASLRDDPRFHKIQELARALSLSQFGDDGDSQDSKRHWNVAVKHYRSFLKDQPNNGRGWFNLGFSLHYAGEHAKAIDAFERAFQLNYKQPTSLYNIACANAMMGNRDVAFEYLEKSVQAGFNVEDYASGDQDLDSLRSDPRFKRYLDVADDKHKEKHKDK